MKARFIYSNNYDFSTWGLNKLHPFDGEKFSKAWKIISSEIKDQIKTLWIRPTNPVSDEVLLKIHTPDYLDSLKHSHTIAKVIEIWPARFFPNKMLQTRLLDPMKLACEGTSIATEVALKENLIAMNFAGGYHHAFSDHGEGFCFFADAALSILSCREKGLLSANDKVLMIDVDAHRGNGFESLTGNDSSVRNFDMYSFQVYPGIHQGDPEKYPYMIPLKFGIKDDVYLSTLRTELKPFIKENSDAKLAFYNAGNDIIETDPLGGLKVSFDGIVKRDQFVLEQLRNMNIPVVVMTSGGYTKQSYKLIAELARTVISVAS